MTTSAAVLTKSCGRIEEARASARSGGSSRVTPRGMPLSRADLAQRCGVMIMNTFEIEEMTYKLQDRCSAPKLALAQVCGIGGTARHSARERSVRSGAMFQRRKGRAPPGDEAQWVRILRGGWPVPCRTVTIGSHNARKPHEHCD